jgi:hypothetical protein
MMTVVHDTPTGACHDAYTYAILTCPWTELQSRLPSRELTTPARSQLTLARWLVTTEMGAEQGPLAGSAAAERVFEKLSHRLAQLITAGGAEALLTRAVHLSRTEFPFLGGVPAAPNTRSLIERLRETVATVEPSQAHEGLISVLGTLIGLLVSFIGEDLTFRLLRDVWPAVPMSPHTPPDAQS